MRKEIARRIDAGQDLAVIATVLGCRFADVLAVRMSIRPEEEQPEDPLANQAIIAQKNETATFGIRVGDDAADEKRARKALGKPNMSLYGRTRYSREVYSVDSSLACEVESFDCV